LVSQEELIWYGEWLESTSEDSFNGAISQFLETMDDVLQQQHLLNPQETYEPDSVTTDGWKASQNAWETQAPNITIMECLLHGLKRLSATIDDYMKVHPETSAEERKRIRTDFEQIFTAPNLASFSQRIRRAMEVYGEEPILLKRLEILKDKRFLFTNHFNFEEASAFSAPLDRSMRFLDEKLQSFGQFRSSDSINPMLNAWAIVNNMRSFLPGAKKAGQSLAEFFGADFHGIPWMEVLNLCTVDTLTQMLPAPFS
jgi:hypothetical protein